MTNISACSGKTAFQYRDDAIKYLRIKRKQSRFGWKDATEFLCECGAWHCGRSSTRTRKTQPAARVQDPRYSWAMEEDE